MPEGSRLVYRFPFRYAGHHFRGQIPRCWARPATGNNPAPGTAKFDPMPGPFTGLPSHGDFSVVGRGPSPLQQMQQRGFAFRNPTAPTIADVYPARFPGRCLQRRVEEPRRLARKLRKSAARRDTFFRAGRVGYPEVRIHGCYFCQFTGGSGSTSFPIGAGAPIERLNKSQMAMKFGHCTEISPSFRVGLHSNKRSRCIESERSGRRSA